MDERTRSVLRRWLLIGALILLALALHMAAGSASRRAALVSTLVAPLRYHPARSHLATPDAIAPDRLPERVPFDYTLHPGETLGAVLTRAGLEDDESRSAVSAAAELTDLRRLRAGDPYTVYYEGDAVVAVHLSIRGRGRLELSRGPGEWRGEYQPYRKRVDLLAIRGRLTGPLESAIRAAGGDSSVAVLMADVLQWDLDFNRDLKVGDTFEVLYERVFLDQRFSGLGRVLAMTYVSGERRLSAYMYGDGNGYYDADGRPLQKMFLRSPMSYTRVTSGFSSHRFHPILKTFRPHYGVDYGAPAGTPVRVTANGVVERAGWETGGGRVVRVRHANGYLTAYLHLSGFAEGVRQGARVRQGQIVGFVGSSGLATAPHLDYRVKLADRWIDPLSLQNEPAPSIPEERLPDFLAWRDMLTVSLREGMARAEVVTAARRIGPMGNVGR